MLNDKPVGEEPATSGGKCRPLESDRLLEVNGRRMEGVALHMFGPQLQWASYCFGGMWWWATDKIVPPFPPQMPNLPPTPTKMRRRGDPVVWQTRNQPHHNKHQRTRLWITPRKGRALKAQQVVVLPQMPVHVVCGLFIAQKAAHS